MHHSLRVSQRLMGQQLMMLKDLDLVMLMYNLLEYSSNYSDMTGSLWFYSKGEVTDFNANIVDGNAFKSFKSQAKLLGNTVLDGANGNLRNTKIEVSK